MPGVGLAKQPDIPLHRAKTQGGLLVPAKGVDEAEGRDKEQRKQSEENDQQEHLTRTWWRDDTLLRIAQNRSALEPNVSETSDVMLAREKCAHACVQAGRCGVYIFVFEFFEFFKMLNYVFDYLTFLTFYTLTFLYILTLFCKIWSILKFEHFDILYNLKHFYLFTFLHFNPFLLFSFWFFTFWIFCTFWLFDLWKRCDSFHSYILTLCHFWTYLSFLTFCVESIPAQVNSGCAVDRHSQRDAWCPGRLVSPPMFSDTLQVLESRHMSSWHTQDDVPLQVHMSRRHDNNYKNRDSIYLYFLLYRLTTPVKCAHIFSNNLTCVDIFSYFSFLSFEFFIICLFWYFLFPNKVAFWIFFNNLGCFLIFHFFIFDFFDIYLHFWFFHLFTFMHFLPLNICFISFISYIPYSLTFLHFSHVSHFLHFWKILHFLCLLHFLNILHSKHFLYCDISEISCMSYMSYMSDILTFWHFDMLF